MDNIKTKCYNEDHPITEAVYYCIECKISMCNKCEGLHSKLFKKHNRITLDKNKDISEIFTGFCKEKNHLDKLDYYCKTHNILCCSGCISKIKLNNKGQHSNCEICSLEDIKENKEKILKENIVNLEKLSNEVDTLIKEIKVVFNKINKDKEELKLNIQKIFTKIRNAINEREDEILSKVDQLFDNVYMKEEEMNDIDKYPNKVKGLLKQGKNEIEKFNANKNDKTLSSFVNSCINIENSLLSINNTEQSLIKIKKGLSSVIKFSPSKENELNEFITNLTSFGKVYKENENIQIEPNTNGNKFIDIAISTSKEELNGLSIKFYPFSNEEYNNYYPKDAIFEEDETVFTLHLDVTNEFLNKIFENKDNYENELKKMIKFKNNHISFDHSKFSLRKKFNKLFLDLRGKIKKGKEDLIFATLLLNHLQILMNFQNNLTFENLNEIDFKELYKNFINFDFSLKGNLKNIENWLKTIENEKKDNKDQKFIGILSSYAKTLNSNEIKMKWHTSLDKFDILKIILKERGLDIDSANDSIKNLWKKFEETINMIVQISEASFSCKISEDIIYDKILITLLYTNLKSGFVLEINTKGINEYLKNVINKNKEL